MTSDVFISYAREDLKHARRLARAFESPPRGWSVWWDFQLRTGERFTKEIEEALRNARCVVVLWSPHSVDSHWVAAEAEIGRERGVLVPVLIADCDPPMPFGQFQSADLRRWRGAESHLEWGKLLDAIQAAFAVGPEVDKAERQARLQRMQAIEKRRTRKRLALGGVVAGIVAVAWWLGSLYPARQAANELARVSEELRAGVQQEHEDSSFVWSHFMENRKTLDRLSASLLVAIEAMRKSPTSRAQHALYDVFALLPWSDQLQELDEGNTPRARVFSPDGQLLVSAGGKGETLIWRVDGLEVIARIDHGRTGGKEWVRERGWLLTDGTQLVDFSPDGKTLGTVAPDNTVRLWTLEGSEIGRMEHNGVTTSVQFSPAGDLLAATDDSGELRLWNPQTGEMVRSWQHQNTKGKIAFSASGNLLGSAGDDGTVVVWDPATGDERLRATAERGELTAFAFAPDDRHLVTLGDGADVWDLETGNKVWRITDNEVYSVVFDRDGKVFILGGEDSLEWWNLETRNALFARKVPYVLDVAAADEDHSVVTLSRDEGAVQGWDSETGRELRRLAYLYDVYSAAIDPAGGRLAVSGTGHLGTVLELPLLRPESLLDIACEYVGRNLTEEEWDEYIGEEPYRLTCPDIEDEQ